MILFCGYANRDVVVQLSDMPHAGERLHAEAFNFTDGGMAANAAVAAARFGAETMFVGSVGSDGESKDFLASLGHDGVRSEWTCLDGYLPHAVILVDGHGERSVISQDDSLKTAHLNAVIAGLDRDTEHWIYVDGYRWDEDWLLNPGNLRVVVDVDGVREKRQVLRAAGMASHLLGSQKTFMGTCGFSESELRELADTRGITIIITRGADGLTFLASREATVEMDAFPTDVVDDTGAGDCFAGVYVAALAAGSPSRAAARAASAAASLSCRGLGARSAPRATEIHEFLTTRNASQPQT